MNVQKTANHSKLFTDIEQVLAQELPLLKLNFEFGKLLDHQQETSAIAAAAEYMADQHPEMGGFSPRSLRRMRAFYRAYKNQPKTLRKAMRIGWTQNIVIFEATLTAAERKWYINATYKYGWSKLVLTRKITEKAYLNTAVQETTASTTPDNHTISNNTVNLGAYFDPRHDLLDMEDSFPRKNAFSRTRKLNLKQVAYLWYPNIKKDSVRVPIIRLIEDLRDVEQTSKSCLQENEPAFLTKAGCAYLVVMSQETYEQQMKVLGIYNKLVVSENRLMRASPYRTGTKCSEDCGNV